MSVSKSGCFLHAIIIISNKHKFLFFCIGRSTSGEYILIIFNFEHILERAFSFHSAVNLHSSSDYCIDNFYIVYILVSLLAMNPPITSFRSFVMRSFMDIKKRFNNSLPMYSFLRNSPVQSETAHLLQWS